MLQNSTNLNNSMIQGDYLQNNPNFDAVMNTAGRKATEQYNNAMTNTNSQASMSGRYGSDAHARMASNNSSNLAQSLADTAGQYAYQNYANERGMQNAAMNNAGAIAGNQNIGAQNLMNAGNMQAGFDQTALNADIARHDYGQNAQQQHLSNYTNAVWGAPGGSTSSTSNSGGGK
jgi:2-hydroxychromene-2-carboxylate isomerase